MNGIEPSPAIVGNHFETNKGRAGVLATANLEALTIQLMTPPGIATLGESEVNSTQWSQAYPRREGGRGVSISVKPYYHAQFNSTTTIQLHIHILVSQSKSNAQIKG